MNFIVLLEAQYAMKYVTVIILKIIYKLLYKLYGVHDPKLMPLHEILSDVKTYATSVMLKSVLREKFTEYGNIFS